jgi:hypothetical protein
MGFQFKSQFQSKVVFVSQMKNRSLFPQRRGGIKTTLFGLEKHQSTRFSAQLEVHEVRFERLGQPEDIADVGRLDQRPGAARQWRLCLKLLSEPRSRITSRLGKQRW